MKKSKLILVFFFLLTGLCSFAQVQIDHQLQMTGSSTNAEITGIKRVANNGDAVSVDYLQRDSLKFAMATGSNNAYVVTLSPAVTSHYTNGMTVYFQANFANTGSATLQVNALSATTIKKNGTSANLAAGDIAVNQEVAVIYDGTYFQMLSQLGNSSAAIPHGKQQFTLASTSNNTSNNTFTVPTGVTAVWVTMCGGGGGGGGGGYASGGTSGGGGGGGGANAYISYPLTLTQSSYAISIGDSGSYGAKGTSGSPTGVTGGTGGSTVFGSGVNTLLTANGGVGGVGGAVGTGGTGGTAGSVSSGTSFYAPAAQGSVGFASGNSNYPLGGAGGNSIYGQGGAGGNRLGGITGVGIGFGSGGGGGGGAATGNTGTDGAAGAPGFMLIEW